MYGDVGILDVRNEVSKYFHQFYTLSDKSLPDHKIGDVINYVRTCRRHRTARRFIYYRYKYYTMVCISQIGPEIREGRDKRRILIFQRGSLGFLNCIVDWLFLQKRQLFYNNMHWKIQKRDFENETSIEPNLCPKAYDFLRMSLTCTIFAHHTNFEYFEWRP